MMMVAHRNGVVAETQSSSNILNPKSKAINHATPNFSSLTVKQANNASFNPQVYPPANHWLQITSKRSIHRASTVTSLCPSGFVQPIYVPPPTLSGYVVDM